MLLTFHAHSISGQADKNKQKKNYVFLEQITEASKKKLPKTAFLVRAPKGVQSSSAYYPNESEPLWDDKSVANLNSNTKPFSKLGL